MACAALLLQHGCQIAATVRAGGGDVIDAVFRTGALPVEVCFFATVQLLQAATPASSV